MQDSTMDVTVIQNIHLSPCSEQVVNWDGNLMDKLSPEEIFMDLVQR